ncbi:MAG: 16S rRNA (cytidine(1402)-2'-O)-methyltransferase [Candidatus Omnitrophica bacterium]|nr:16S rRNA (cytidine(1402)-2'-O)-methyltransferase [Candidatus Omnitrophota bacterium]
MNPGTLYIVSTPIGNLEDITLRAIRILKEVAIIACEDTRHTKILTSRYGIDTRLISYFQYNRIQKGEFLLKHLKDGKDVALVSDAGTPGISDPGAHMIKLAIENGITVIPIPGPTALITALVISGKPTHKFVFEGFLSNKSSQRRKRLQELTSEKRTVILYESPHRLTKMLADILEIYGDVDIVLARELTKKFEEAKRDKASSLLEHFTKTKPRGEFILII